MIVKPAPKFQSKSIDLAICDLIEMLWKIESFCDAMI